MEVFGVHLVGIDQNTGNKVLFTLVLVLVFVVLRTAFSVLIRLVSKWRQAQLRFWTQQVASLFTGAILLLGLVSIWFSDTGRLATVLGLFTAGLAFALQKVVTAFAGYFVILRGNIFHVGDRIAMGAVRGDVIGLGFINTTVMEMGEPPGEKGDAPAIWIEGRQFTGRIVTVSNAAIFDHPVYNYSRDFPLIWEELRLPVRFDADHERAAALLLDCAARHTAPLQEQGRAGLRLLLDRYGMPGLDLAPRVFYRLSENWIELSVRFVAPPHGSRVLKDAMSRELLRTLAQEGIDIAPRRQEITLRSR